MPLYQGSSFLGEEQYQELTKLHLPGPAVVIDVRQGTDHDPPLIWNLAIELEDFSTEMSLNQVYRWRSLTDCIDLLKLTPLRADELEEKRVKELKRKRADELKGERVEELEEKQADELVGEMTDFILTTSTGQVRSLHGKRELIKELGREHLDRVRNNRIGAGRDKGQETTGVDLIVTDPEQVTVRVFFLVDANDIDSLVSAIIYAKWLKDWYHEYGEQGRSGRDRRISTFAICMNVDSHLPDPILAQNLNYTPNQQPSIDAVILLNIYGDDDAYIGGDIQSYQVELILYALLLLSLESLVSADQDTPYDQSLSSYVYTEEPGSQPAAPWAIYTMGISSLEYSARWGGRWLDYGLVAKIIEILHESEEVDREHQLGRMRREVHEKLKNWQQEVNAIVPDDFTRVIPELQVLDEMKQSLTPFASRKKKHISPIEDLNAFSQQISHLYTGDDNTLEKAIESARIIPWQLKREYLQIPKNNAELPPLAIELYQKLIVLRSQAAQLPVSLFRGAQGMLPRTLWQLAELAEAIDEIREVAENPPDLKECCKQFNRQVEQERIQLQRVIHSQHWPFTRKLRQQSEESVRQLSTIVRSHLQQVRTVIASRVALVLLEEVGLYNPDKGKLSLYHQRVKHLDIAMLEAQKRASLQQQRAYERLKVSLSDTQVGVSQTPTWLSLNSRKDWLNWAQIVESFELLYKELEATPTALNLLMEWLLRLCGTEKPLTIAEQYINDIKSREQPDFFKSIKLEQAYLHGYSTILVAVLLLFDIVGFDIATIQPLLDKYLELKDHFPDDSSVLDTNILGLQRIVRDAKATRSSIGRKTQKQPFSSFSFRQNQPFELILAAWVNNLCSDNALLAETLDQSGILARLVAKKTTPVQALQDLQARNSLLGYQDSMAGHDLYYLLIAPGMISEDFLKELAHSSFSHIRPVHFPDAEKLIYLHIHQIHHVMASSSSPAQKQLSPNV